MTERSASDGKYHAKLAVFCIGATCSGKTTFIDYCTSIDDRFGSVMVGKQLRAKYSAGYFQGKGAIHETEHEAMEIFTKQLADRVNEGKTIILIDGQPRLPGTVDKYISIVSESVPNFIFLWFRASVNDTTERISKRFPDDRSSRDLAIHRIANDRIQLYDVIQEILCRFPNNHCGLNMFVADSSHLNAWLNNVIYISEFLSDDQYDATPIDLHDFLINIA